MKLLVSFVCLGFFLSNVMGHGQAQRQADAKVRVEFRLAKLNPAPGLAELEAPPNGLKLYLHREAIITNEDIVEVVAQPALYFEGQYQINFTFTDAAGERLAKFSEAHQLEMMALVVDAKIIAIASIAGKPGSKIQLTGAFTKDSAEKVVRDITGKDPGAQPLPEKKTPPTQK